MPVESYDPEFVGSRTELWDELVLFVKRHKGGLIDGFYVLPEDISEFPNIASALNDLVMRYFPNHFLCPDCSLPARDCVCPGRDANKADSNSTDVDDHTDIFRIPTLQRLRIAMPDERLAKMFLDDMKICTACYRVYRFWRENNFGDSNPWWSQPLYQYCSCSEKADVPPDAREPWSEFDFNEAITLCYCCQREILRSGSKWSVWFCEACKERVSRYNREAGTYLIPIGRHSAMGISFSADIGLTGQELDDPQKVQRFREGTEMLHVQSTLIDVWRQDYLRYTIGTLVGQGLLRTSSEPDLKLVDYLTAARRDLDGAKAIASERMCRAIA